MSSEIEKAKKLFLDGIDLLNNKDFLNAEHKFKESIIYAPNRTSTLLNLAATQISLNNIEEALANLNKLLDIEPNNYLAMMNISNIYCILRNFDKALSHIDKAIMIENHNQDLISNKASILRFMGQIDDALALYEMASKNYYSHSINFNKSLCQLTLQNFTDGWNNYEYRDLENLPNINKLDLNNKILIQSEQGIGDVIMFTLLLKFLDNHQRLSFEIDQRLFDLYQYSFPDINFLKINQYNKLDYEIYDKIRIGSLSQFFFKKVNDIKKVNTPFLKIPPKFDIENRHIDKSKINIGIYWSSHSKQEGKVKKMNLSNLIESINFDNKNFISIQDGDYEEEIMQVQNDLNVKINIVKTFNLRDDFNSLANLISKCDLIVSISTTVVHLAGALGVPTIIMAQYSPDWRFFQFEEDFVWYKNTQILKQKKLDDWSEPLKKLNDKINYIIYGDNISN